jgi:hypothetical protein
MHAFILLRHVVENAKRAHAKFPDRQFVFERWCQVNQALASSRGHARLVSELLANIGEDAPLIESPKRLQFLDRQLGTTISYAIKPYYTLRGDERASL